MARHSDTNQEQLQNLGPVSTAWLKAVSIHTREDLERIGVEGAFELVFAHGFNASLNLIYALEGAITDTYWREIPEERKKRLRAFVKFLKTRKQ